ncbi:MAG: nitrilase-related carbon-nitrogen hydrolase [Bacillota bacterium]
MGARIIFYPSAEMVPFENRHDIQTRGRAAENGVFIANANQMGAHGSNALFGRSKIVGPSGELLARAGITEERNSSFFLTNIQNRYTFC